MQHTRQPTKESKYVLPGSQQAENTGGACHGAKAGLCRLGIGWKQRVRVCRRMAWHCRYTKHGAGLVYVHCNDHVIHPAQ